MIRAFPLAWPDGWPRTKHRKSSSYKVSTESALNELLGGLRLMGGRDIIVSSNVPLRRDGTMYRGDHSDSRMPDPGVAVYWTARGKKGEPVPRVIPCDVWHTVRENVRALGMAIEYLRGLERTGAGEILERAFQGFALLSAAQDCWTVLGVQKGVTKEALRERFRELARTQHPDRGGDPVAFARVTEAYHEAMGLTA